MTLKVGVLVALVLAEIWAPHFPGCMPGEAAQLAGIDKGATTLSMMHEVGETSIELFKAGKMARGTSNIVIGVQRMYAISYNCARCLAAYVQCAVTAAECQEFCADFKTSECKVCVARVCGANLLHCTRANIEFPVVEAGIIENFRCFVAEKAS